MAGSAINNHNIGYPMLGIVPTDKSMAISNSNAVILSLLHIMGLPDPGPTWGFAPGRGTLLFVPGEENALRNYLGLPDTSENGSDILQNQTYGYEYDKTDENGVQLYDIKYDTEHNSEFIGRNAPDLTFDNSNINFASNSSGRIVGDFDEININSGSKVNLNGKNIEISATYASLNLENKSSADITGDKDVIKLENSVRATINGSGDTVNALGANDLVVAGGNGRTADALDTITFANGGTAGVAENSRVDVYGNGVATTLNGNDISSIYGSGNTVNATGADDDIWISGQNNNITASNASINFFASSLANVFGQDEFVQLQSDANSKISITWHDFTVDGDSGNNAIILNSDTSVKISGGGNILIIGEYTVVFASNDKEFNISVESGVTSGAIYARNSIISLPTGWHGDVSGEGNIITGGGDIGGGDIGGFGDIGEGLERTAQYVTTSLRGDPSSDRQPSRDCQEFRVGAAG